MEAVHAEREHFTQSHQFQIPPGIGGVPKAGGDEQGQDRRASLLTAGRVRLRPIIMTTVAMIFGMIPLALAIGAGAEARAPMARAVIGGLITSTLLTLFVVPVMYTYLDDLGRAVASRFKSAAEQEEAHGAVPVAGD